MVNMIYNYQSIRALFYLLIDCCGDINVHKGNNAENQSYKLECRFSKLKKLLANFKNKVEIQAIKSTETRDE